MLPTCICSHRLYRDISSLLCEPSCEARKKKQLTISSSILYLILIYSHLLYKISVHGINLHLQNNRNAHKKTQTERNISNLQPGRISTGITAQFTAIGLLSSVYANVPCDLLLVPCCIFTVCAFVETLASV